MQQSFGERLRMLRKRRGMTQTDLARALGWTVQTVVRYESLRLDEVRPAKLKAIADALRVEEAELKGEQSDSGMMGVLTRGLRNMEPAERDSLIELVMPYVMRHQKPPEGESEG